MYVLHIMNTALSIAHLFYYSSVVTVCRHVFIEAVNCTLHMRQLYCFVGSIVTASIIIPANNDVIKDS